MSEPEIWHVKLNVAAAASVLKSNKHGLADLARAGGLDPRNAFRGRDLSGWPLAGQDVRGIDFSGSDLRGTGVDRSIYDQTTLFDGVQLDFGTVLTFEINEIPEDFQDQAREMILRGQAPPRHWIPGISTLDFSGEKGLEDIGLLADLTALTEVGIEGTSVSDISSLEKLQYIVRLNIARTKISDLSPISKLHNLEFLDIDSTEIADISALSNLPTRLSP